ncbi:sensor histidine kinase [Rickettsiella endosymbiont of Dermanyssus gallinae]|uniref:sensor histidine kinase n=1 Tax=Rickettsiella endosymbiont of Dermanyssus gallinae TaxID=2856608 RepID=UPI003CCEA0A8
MDKSDHDRIFEKYEKIKPSYKSSTFTGCGMGLYLVKQLLEDLKGTITLESELDKGSTFQIEIPLFI